MKKIYYLFMPLVFLFTNFIYAQIATCPESFGNQGSLTVIHFKIAQGTCDDYDPVIFVSNSAGYNQTFTRTSCNGPNLKYTSTDSDLPNETLTFKVRFVEDGLQCNYVNCSLAVLSNKDLSLDKMLSVYPNPFMSGDNITIKVATNISAKLNLYNVTGKLVLKNEINNFNEAKLNAANLTNGMYFLQVETDEASATRKIIIMK